MQYRRHEQVADLADVLGVSTRTIKNDLKVLASDYEVETIRGNGGGVRLRGNCRIYKGSITEVQQNALIEGMKVVKKPIARAYGELLQVQGSLRNKAKIEKAISKTV